MLEKLSELYRRVTALEKLVHNELKEEIVELDSRVDSVVDGMSALNARMDKFTSTMSTLMLMTGGVERNLDRLVTVVETLSLKDAQRHEQEDVRHAALLALVHELSQKLDRLERTA